VKFVKFLPFIIILIISSCSTGNKVHTAREIELLESLEKRTLEEIKNKKDENNGSSVILPVLDGDVDHVYSKDPY
jgi:hypothetical protein